MKTEALVTARKKPGAKPKPIGERKVSSTMRLSPDVITMAKLLAKAGHTTVTEEFELAMKRHFEPRIAEIKQKEQKRDNILITN